jgi:hypothetical protein
MKRPWTSLAASTPEASGLGSQDLRVRGHLSHGLGLDHYTRWLRAALPSCRQRVPGSARPRALIGACQGATSGGMCHRFQMGKACPIAQANRYGHGSRDSWHEWHVVRQFQQLGNRQGKQRLGGERASVRRHAGPTREVQESPKYQTAISDVLSVISRSPNPRYDRSSGCTPL